MDARGAGLDHWGKPVPLCNWWPALQRYVLGHPNRYEWSYTLRNTLGASTTNASVVVTQPSFPDVASSRVSFLAAFQVLSWLMAGPFTP